MTIVDQIEDEKLQYDINRKPAKISALSSGEQILPSNQKQVMEEAKFTCSSLGKAFEKQIKYNGRSRRKTNKSNSKPRRN